jgi:hypothetical protein
MRIPADPDPKRTSATQQDLLHIFTDFPGSGSDLQAKRFRIQIYCCTLLFKLFYFLVSEGFRT